jgi:hypothetical protein
MESCLKILVYVLKLEGGDFMSIGGLRQKLLEVDERFKKIYRNLDKEKIVSVLFKVMSQPVKLKKLSGSEIEGIVKGMGIVGVDGSINTYGGIYPHYIALIQSLAKSTLPSEKEISLQDIYVPVFEDDDGQAEDEQKRRSRMSRLELESASLALESFSSRIILMDGSLMHYSIDCPDDWRRFKEKALSLDKIIIGVTEEVKTKDIANLLKTEINIKENTIYDREILFGILKEGEMLELRADLKSKKAESGFRSCYVRLSEDPQVAGLDFIEEQYSEAIGYADLIYTLTPSKGRGIPLWLDIVDKEVKITDEMVNGLVESSISKDIREIILNPKRNKRG